MRDGYIGHLGLHGPSRETKMTIQDDKNNDNMGSTSMSTSRICMPGFHSTQKAKLLGVVGLDNKHSP